MRMPDAIPLSTYLSTIELTDRDTINKRIQRGIWQLGVHIVNVDGALVATIIERGFDLFKIKNNGEESLVVTEAEAANFKAPESTRIY